jgi:opacity protein-like surface antigen
LVTKKTRVWYCWINLDFNHVNRRKFVRQLIYALVLAVSGFMMPQASAQDFGFGCCSPACGSCCESGFDGIYVGGNLGAFHNLVSCNDYDAFFSRTAPAGFSAGRTAFTAGVQLGFDWQCGNKLLGIVGDWNWTHAKRNFPFVSNGLIPGLTVANTNKNRWFSTIRARAGVVVCCDALIYVTGGAAVIDHRSGWIRTDILAGLNDSHHAKDHQWGWTAGVGVEYKMGCNWSLGAEVLSLHFSERQRRVTGVINEAPTILPFRLGFTDSAYVARVLLNYRVGSLLGF